MPPAASIRPSMRGISCCLRTMYLCGAPNPLIGANIDELGVRFPDMTHVYDPALRNLIKEAAAEQNIGLQEGVYAQLTGPSFESPAEIRLLHQLGVDAVGMSTVVEAIAANHMGMRICCISCVCNLYVYLFIINPSFP